MFLEVAGEEFEIEAVLMAVPEPGREDAGGVWVGV